MALSANNTLTLIELAKRHDPDGDTAVIAEVLNEENEILSDAPWDEANDVTSHKMTRRLTLPTGTHRKLNAGVPIEASKTVEVRETVAMLESYSQCDKKLADIAKDPAQFRMNEAKSFIEGMGQTMAYKLIYGNSATTPEEPTGFAPRMASLDTADNVLDGGASGGTSVFVVMWGLDKVFMLYPRNSKTVGIDHQDLGEVTLEDASGNLYQGYRDHFEANYGLAVKDNRCIGRIANIAVTGSSNTFDEDDLITLINRMPKGNKSIYVNNVIMTQMQIRVKDKNNVYYTPGDSALSGEPVVRFNGHPVRRVDQILTTESTLT